MAEVRTICQNR